MKNKITLSILLLTSQLCFSQILTHSKEIGLYQINKKSKFIYDEEMLSPKSVEFIDDKLFINALEKGNTLIYSTNEWKKESSIVHNFLKPNILQIKNSQYPIINQPFMGKPVEFAHNKNNLWISYYRLSFDSNSKQGSVIAQVNLKTMEIEQLIPTGSIPKMLKISNNNKVLVSTNWGDNTVGFYSLDNNIITSFDSVAVEYKLNTANIFGDRDKNCGYCLRGTIFTLDDKYLIVGRMGGGGIAIIDVVNKKYIGTIFNVPSTPRHIILSKDGKTLYLSTVASSQVTKIDMSKIYKDIALLEKKSKPEIKLNDWQTVNVGSGVRTIALSKDEKFIYAAFNGSSELGVIDNQTMTIKEKYKIASFPVGLAVSDNDQYIAVTSQGKNGIGGNHVDIFERN